MNIEDIQNEAQGWSWVAEQFEAADRDCKNGKDFDELPRLVKKGLCLLIDVLFRSKRHISIQMDDRLFVYLEAKSVFLYIWPKSADHLLDRARLARQFAVEASTENKS